MKRRRPAEEKESWEEFEKRFENKRNNAKKPAVGKVPSDYWFRECRLLPQDD